MPLTQIVMDLLNDLGHPRVLWQLLALSIAFAIAWVSSRWLEHQIGAQISASRETASSAVKQAAIDLGAAALSRVLFSLFFLIAIWLAKFWLARFFPVKLLTLAIPLVISFVVIRILVYLLRKVVRDSGLLRAFERVLATFIWFIVAMHLIGVLPELTEALQSISIPMGKSNFSVYDLLAGVASISVTILIALWAGSGLERRLMHTESLDSSMRVVLARAARALLLVLAMLTALPLVGIDLTLLSVFGGALGVGLGLGLQRIASNYVSGFIILLDKSLRIGDMVTAGQYYGMVTQIKTRYTVIRALDGNEAIVPNELLVSQPVVNHSYTNRQVRLVTRVAVAYHHEAQQILDLLVQAARENPRVLSDPAPSAALVELGAEGMVFDLGFWITDPEQGRANVTSEINVAILHLFGANSIEIPYPQRDIRYVS